MHRDNTPATDAELHEQGVNPRGLTRQGRGTTAAEIAASLSKAQREALLKHHGRLPYGSYDRGWPGNAKEDTSFCKAGRVLMDMGLIAWASDLRGDSRTILTERGDAVAAECAILLRTPPTTPKGAE